MAKRRRGEKTGFIEKMIFFLNLLAASLLLASYLSPWIDPKSFWPIALLGIAYVPLLIVNVIFIAYWLLTRPIRVLVSLTVILLGWSFLNAHFGLDWGRGTKPEYTTANDSTAAIRILSYNVHLFRGPNQPGNIPSIKDEAIKLIENVAPDVVCIQEYYTRQKGDHDVSRSFRKHLGLSHQFVHSVAKNNYESYGMAIFSKYPIVASGRVSDFEQGVNSIIYADIDKEGRLFRVYNVHLRSFAFQQEDYDFIKSPRSGSLESNVSHTKRIGSRMKHAFEIRSQQARSLKDHSQHSTIPYLIAGDFNDTPLSFAVNHVGRKLQNAFHEKGRGRGVTYKGDFPSFQIDYIMASPEFDVRKFEIIKRDLSDHYPVWADVTFR